MRIVLWFILLLVVLSWSDESDAARWLTPDGQRAGVEQRNDNRSALPTPNQNIRIVLGRSPGLGERMGAVYCDDPTTVYMRYADAWAQAHETFHVFDCQGLTPRAALAAVNGWEGCTSWWVECNGHASPAELAADAYASCAVTPRRGWGQLWRVISGYGWYPTRWQFKSTCRILANDLKGGI